MGWFDSIVNFGKRVIGNIGPSLKKIGSIGMSVGKRIAEWAPTVSGIAGTLLDGIAAATAQPEIALLGESIRAGGQLIGSYANTGHAIASHVNNAGESFSNLTSGLGD